MASTTNEFRNQLKIGFDNMVFAERLCYGIVDMRINDPSFTPNGWKHRVTLHLPRNVPANQIMQFQQQSDFLDTTRLGKVFEAFACNRLMCKYTHDSKVVNESLTDFLLKHPDTRRRITEALYNYGQAFPILRQVSRTSIR